MGKGVHEGTAADDSPVCLMTFPNLSFSMTLALLNTCSWERAPTHCLLQIQDRLCITMLIRLGSRHPMVYSVKEICARQLLHLWAGPTRCLLHSVTCPIAISTAQRLSACCTLLAPQSKSGCAPPAGRQTPSRQEYQGGCQGWHA